MRRRAAVTEDHCKATLLRVHGTERERAIYAQVLKRNTLDRELVERYETNAHYFRNTLARAGRSEDFHGASLRKSVLFGMRYLCVYLADEYFALPGHSYDAFCRAKWWTFPFPVICLPKSRARDQSTRFRSIVEHEMVHANQGLTKRLPSLTLEGADDFAAFLGTPREKRVLSADECVHEVCTHAAAEFEAYFLQHGRWPQKELPRPRLVADFTLFKWSFMLGWVDALRRLLTGVYCGVDILEAVLEALHRKMPSLLLSLDASEEDARWFTDDQPRLVSSIATATRDDGITGIASDVARADDLTLPEVALAWTKRRT